VAPLAGRHWSLFDELDLMLHCDKEKSQSLMSPMHRAQCLPVYVQDVCYFSADAVFRG
jgi:hypothetical protein